MDNMLCSPSGTLVTYISVIWFIAVALSYHA